jgi:hypothetical protein
MGLEDAADGKVMGDSREIGDRSGSYNTFLESLRRYSQAGSAEIEPSEAHRALQRTYDDIGRSLHYIRRSYRAIRELEYILERSRDIDPEASDLKSRAEEYEFISERLEWIVRDFGMMLDDIRHLMTDAQENLRLLLPEESTEQRSSSSVAFDIESDRRTRGPTTNRPR